MKRMLVALPAVAALVGAALLTTPADAQRGGRGMHFSGHAAGFSQGVARTGTFARSGTFARGGTYGASYARAGAGWNRGWGGRRFVRHGYGWGGVGLGLAAGAALASPYYEYGWDYGPDVYAADWGPGYGYYGYACDTAYIGVGPVGIGIGNTCW